MGPWLAATPALVVGALVLLLPGLAVAWAGGLRGYVAWGVAPLMSLSLLAVADIAAVELHIRWSVAPLLLVTALSVGVLAAARSLLRSRRSRLHQFGPERPRTRLDELPWFLGPAGAAGAVIALAAAWGMGRPDAISQTYDGPFHLNAIEAILRSGSAAAGTVAGVSSSTGSGGFYPPIFHAVAALVVQLTGVSVVSAANVVALAAAGVAWPLSMALLVRAVLGRDRMLLVAAMVATASIPLFPYLLLQFGVLWPNELSLSVLPAVLALMVWAVGHTPYQSLRPWVAVGWGLASVPGLYYAHPGTVFAALGLGVPLGAARLIRYLAQRWGQGAAGQRSAVVIALGVIIVAAAFWQSLNYVPMLQVVRSFNWTPSESSPQALGEGLSLASNLSGPVWAIGAVVIVGAAVVLTRRFARWLVVAHALSVWAFVLAASSDSVITRQVTGFWYNDRERISAILPVTAVPLFAVGVVWLRGRLSDQLLPMLRSLRIGPVWLSARADDLAPRLSAVVVLAAVVALLPGKLGIGADANTVRFSYADAPHVLVSPAERGVYAGLGSRGPLGSAVVGNPWNGAVYAEVLSGHPIVFSHLNMVLDMDRQLVAQHFKDYQTVPAVCAAVQRLNIGFAVEDPKYFWPDDTRVNDYPGLTNLANSRGLHRIETKDGVSVYRVDSCRH